MYYVLDTNISLFYLKENQQSRYITQNFSPFGEGNTPLISIVTVGEIGVLARKHNWGTRRLRQLANFYESLVVVDGKSTDLIGAYIDIDSYSQGTHPTRPLIGSSRNMGKNDVWIAATAFTTGAELITADNDFQHLHGEFLSVHTIQ